MPPESSFTFEFEVTHLASIRPTCCLVEPPEPELSLLKNVIPPTSLSFTFVELPTSNAPVFSMPEFVPPSMVKTLL